MQQPQPQQITINFTNYARDKADGVGGFARINGGVHYLHKEYQRDGKPVQATLLLPRESLEKLEADLVQAKANLIVSYDEQLASIRQALADYDAAPELVPAAPPPGGVS